MIYDYSLLTSFLFTSLFIFIVVYSIYHIRSGSALGEKKKSEEQVISKQIAFDLKLINILLIILIGIRVFFLIVYPLELEDNSIANSLFSIRFNFLVLQGAAIACYIYYLFRLKLIKKISENAKKSVTVRVLIYCLIISTSELFISFLFYAYLNYYLLLPELNNNVFLIYKSLEAAHLYYFGITIFVLFSLFILSYFLLRKKKSYLNFFIFTTLFFIANFMAFLLTVNQLPLYFHQEFLTLYSLKLLSFSTGYAGWIYLFILFTGIGSQFFNLVVLRNRQRFSNQQIAVNYSLQLTKIGILSSGIICTIAILPLIFSILTSMLR